jgi:hypothetical protein
MNTARMLVGATIVACSVVAIIACSGGLAANDPRGIDWHDDEIGRPTKLLLGPEPKLPSAIAAPATGNPLWGIPLQTLGATRERPLFTPSRRPPMAVSIAPPIEPVKVAAAPVEPEQPPLTLLGIVLTGTAEGYAVLINTATKEVVRLKTGEGHDGWILHSVSGREAVFEKNNRTAVIAMPALKGDQK